MMLPNITVITTAVVLLLNLGQHVVMGQCVIDGDGGMVEDGTALCSAPDACKGAKITGCDAVECVGMNACEKVIIDGAESVLCGAGGTCKNSVIQNVPEDGLIQCLGPNACTNINIAPFIQDGGVTTSLSLIECNGDFACGNTQTREGTIQLMIAGPEGYVRCNGPGACSQGENSVGQITITAKCVECDSSSCEGSNVFGETQVSESCEGIPTSISNTIGGTRTGDGPSVSRAAGNGESSSFSLSALHCLTINMVLVGMTTLSVFLI